MKWDVLIVLLIVGFALVLWLRTALRHGLRHAFATLLGTISSVGAYSTHRATTIYDNAKAAKNRPPSKAAIVIGGVCQLSRLMTGADAKTGYGGHFIDMRSMESLAYLSEDDSTDNYS